MQPNPREIVELDATIEDTELEAELPAEPDRRYRAIQGLAVGSIAMGVLSALTALDWWFAPLPIAGIVLAWLAIKRIRRNPDELTGMGLAKFGLWLTIVVWSVGCGSQVYQYYTGTPSGYRRVQFRQLQPAPDEKDVRVPLSAEEWDNVKIFIRGYMFRPKQPMGLKEFILIDGVDDCGYCKPNPKVTERILVKLKGNFRTDYTTRAVGVGGVFTIHRDPSEEGTRGLVYVIEADVIR